MKAQSGFCNDERQIGPDSEARTTNEVDIMRNANAKELLKELGCL